MSPEQSYASRPGFLICGFILTLGLLLAVSLIGQNRVNDIGKDFETLIQQDVAQVNYLAQMRNAARNRMINLWKISVMDDILDRNDTYEDFLDAGTDFLIARGKFVETNLSHTEKKLYEKLSVNTGISSQYHRDVVIKMLDNENYISNDEVLHDVIPSNNNSLKVLDELIYLQNAESLSAFEKTSHNVSRTTTIMAVLTIITMAIGSIFAIYNIYVNKKLISRIHNTNWQLEQNNQDLELRVEKRTAQLQSANDRLEEIAHYDTLTGLANRHLLVEQLRIIIAQAKRDQKKVAVIFIDLDGFKPVNDTYGHTTGDLVLKQVATRLRSLTRESDLASRIGGDEFIIVLSSIHEEIHAVMFARKLIATIAEHYQVNGHKIALSASVGVSYYPGDAEAASQILDYADIAMYEAKRAGKNQHRRYNQTTEKAI